MERPFLTPLLPSPDREGSLADDSDRLRRALAADPALAGRASCDGAGLVTLTGPSGNLPPASLKERQAWEHHVRLRVAAELGKDVASGLIVRWGSL